MVVMGIEEIEYFTALLITKLTPGADTVTTSSIPALAWNIRCLGKPKVPLVQQIKTTGLIEDSGVFARILPVITSGTDIGIALQFGNPVQHMLEPFLCPEDIEIVETDQSFHHLLAVRPGIYAILLRIHTKVKSRHVQFALPVCSRAGFFHGP